MKAANHQMSPNHMVASNHPAAAAAGSPQQHKTAAAFFAKKKKSGLQLPPSANQLASPTRHSSSDHNGGSHLSQTIVSQMRSQTAYGSILSHCPPIPPPPVLKRMLEGKEGGNGGGQSAMGKVRVYLRVLTKGWYYFIK